MPQDAAEAVKWFRLATEQGHASAQFSLGNMYYAPARACRKTMPRQ